MLSEIRARRLRQLHERLLDQARFHQQCASVVLNEERATLASLHDKMEEADGDDAACSLTVAEFALRRVHATQLWERVTLQRQVVAQREWDLEQRRSHTMLVYQDLSGWETLERNIRITARQAAERADARAGDDAAVMRYTRADRADRPTVLARADAEAVARGRS